MHDNETLYFAGITADDFRDREMWAGDFDVIGPLLSPDATDKDCADALEKVIEHAARIESGCWTNFERWFCNTDYWDEVQAIFNHAIDDYLSATAFEVLATSHTAQCEPVITYRDGDATVTKTLQENGWIHVVIEHDDGTIEDTYEKY